MDMHDQQPSMTDVTAATHAATLRDPHLLDLEAYWKTLRHAQRLPARSDLDPKRIDRALPYSFILQRVAPGIARFRVAGQQIHRLIKMDARGMPLGSLFYPEARDTLQNKIEKAFQGPAIVGIPLVSPGGLMRPELHGAMLLLPMQDAQGDTNRILGALVYQDLALPRARRFDIDANQMMRCDMLGPALVTSQLVPKTPATQKGPDTSKHPALRLVVNNG